MIRAAAVNRSDLSPTPSKPNSGLLHQWHPIVISDDGDIDGCNQQP